MASGNETQQRKLELIQLLETQRNSIAGGRHIVRQQFINQKRTFKDKFNIPKRIKTSIRTNSTKWILGAVATGLAITLLKGRRRELTTKRMPVKRRAFFSALILGIVRPMVKGWVVKQVTKLAANKVQQIQDNA